jgi:hypothetical protein
MTEEETNSPGLSDEGERRHEAKNRRLAEALRENLQKRKQQSRARDASSDRIA